MAIDLVIIHVSENQAVSSWLSSFEHSVLRAGSVLCKILHGENRLALLWHTDYTGGR
jgi:hypothetical protein